MNHQEQTVAPETHATKSGPSPWPPAIIGLLAVIAGPFAYTMLMDVPWVLSSGAPAFALMALGVALSFVALQRRAKLGTILIAGLNSLLLAVFAIGFFFLAALPASAQFGGLESAPEFSLVDETGTEVRLAAARADGPVLLVFYRGFW